MQFKVGVAAMMSLAILNLNDLHKKLTKPLFYANLLHLQT